MKTTQNNKHGRPPNIPNINEYSCRCSTIFSFNPFTATGRIHTSPKRPSRWPRTYIYVPPQFRFYAFVKARPPAWLLLHVSEVSSSSVRWSLLALLGLFYWENSSSLLRAVFVQMAGNSVVAVPRCDKLVRAVRLMAFVTTAIEERAQLVSSCWKRGLRMTVDICWERKLVTGAPGGENDHTSAVNEDFDVSTHSERSPGHSLRRGIVGTNVRASLRVKHCESAVRRNPKQEPLCQNVGKITIIHLKDPRR